MPVPSQNNFIAFGVPELTYTAWDLQPFSQDVGSNSAPFIWDDQRRFLMRCELDALYFHLYQINRADVDYIMETFPIVKRKDEAAHSSYRIKDTILAMYDQMASLPTLHIPAPRRSIRRTPTKVHPMTLYSRRGGMNPSRTVLQIDKDKK